MTSTKATGQMTRFTVMAFIKHSKEVDMKATGLMTSRMVKVLKHGLMAQSISEVIRMA